MKEVKKDIRLDIRKKWQELVSEYENREVSGSEFCKKHKISRSGIYKWRKYFNDEAKRAEKSHVFKERASRNYRSREGMVYSNVQEESGFIPLRIESEIGNKTGEFYNKQEAAGSKQGKKINYLSDEQISKINSPIRISKNSGITIEFTDGCTIVELNKIIEVINAAQ